MPKIMQISIKSSENVFHDGRSIVINSGTGCANVAYCNAMHGKHFIRIIHTSICCDFDKWSDSIQRLNTNICTSDYKILSRFNAHTHTQLTATGLLILFSNFLTNCHVHMNAQPIFDENVQRLWFMTVAFNRHSGFCFFFHSWFKCATFQRIAHNIDAQKKGWADETNRQQLRCGI